MAECDDHFVEAQLKIVAFISAQSFASIHGRISDWASDFAVRSSISGLMNSSSPSREWVVVDGRCTTCGSSGLRDPGDYLFPTAAGWDLLRHAGCGRGEADDFPTPSSGTIVNGGHLNCTNSLRHQSWHGRSSATGCVLTT